MAGERRVIELCTKDEIEDGEILKVEVESWEFAVYNVDGEFFVTNDACTHGPGSLSEGYLDGHVIECDFHNGAFDIRTGEIVAPPCMIPLKTYSVVPDGAKVIIEAPAD